MVNKRMNLTEVKSKIKKIKLFTAPASILIAISLYALFSANGDAIHPLLNNKNVVYIILMAGVVIEIVALFKLLPLLKLQKELSSK